MLKRSKRIQGKPLVQALLKDGESISRPFFVLIKKENALPSSRYSVIVGKKLEKSAVKRNRKRRQVYEIIRLLERENGVPKQVHFDIVLLVRRPAIKADFTQLTQELRSLLIHSLA